MPVDWRLLGQNQRDIGLASVADMLNAFHDRRMKERNAQLEAETQRQAIGQRRDAAMADYAAKELDREQRLKIETAKADWDRSQATSNVIEKNQDRISTGDYQPVNMALASLGRRLQERPAAAPPSLEAAWDASAGVAPGAPDAPAAPRSQADAELLDLASGTIPRPTADRVAEAQKYQQSRSAGPTIDLVDINAAKDAPPMASLQVGAGVDANADLMDKVAAETYGRVPRDNALWKRALDAVKPIAHLQRSPKDLADALEKAYQSELNNMHSDKRAAMAQAAATGRAAGMRPAEEARIALAASNQAQALWNSTYNQQGMTAMIQTLRDMRELHRALASNNPAMHKQAAGLWDKLASGPGAVQASEREEFRKTIGGVWESFRQRYNNVFSQGELPEAQRKLMLKAYEETILPAAESLVTGLRDTFVDPIRDHPLPGVNMYADWATKRFDSIMSGARLAPARPPQQPAPSRAPASGASSYDDGDDPALDEVLGGGY
jgi:hypothetical protein